MFFIAYAFKGQVHVFAGRVKNLQEECNIEIFLCPVLDSGYSKFWGKLVVRLNQASSTTKTSNTFNNENLDEASIKSIFWKKSASPSVFWGHLKQKGVTINISRAPG